MIGLVATALAATLLTHTYLFTDDFNGTTLSPAWHTRGTDYEVGATRARGSDAAVSVRHGHLRLRVLDDPTHPGNYLNGHVSTEGGFTFTHGWASARVRVPPFAGSHAAFWLLSPTLPGDYAGHEVDVVESYGSVHPNAPSGSEVWHGVWYPDPAVVPQTGVRFIQEEGSVNSNDFATTPWHQQYHTYTVHWTPARYTYWIDGVRVATIIRGLCGTPKFLILSLLTRDWEVPALLTHALTTYVMRVDWVRVWTRR